MSRVRVTTVAVEKQHVLHILSVCSVALVTQHAMRISHTVIRGLSGYTKYFHIIS